MPLKGAIIGFGNVAARAHVPVWKQAEAFTIGAVVEPCPQHADRARELLPEARIYSDYGSMLAEGDLDFVDICAPPCCHEEYIVSACRAGLHAFCEKPLVPTRESMNRVLRAAADSGRTVFTVNNWKYAPIWIHTGKIIRRKTLGRLQSISLNVLRPPGSGGGASDWRRCPEIAGGGILLDHGWHHLYLILSLLQQPPLSVSADMVYSETNGSGLEETVSLGLGFPRAEARLYLTWQASRRKNFGIIKGTRGSVVVKDDHLVVFEDGHPPRQHVFPEALSAGSQHPEWMKPVIDNFYREIADTAVRGENLQEARLCSEITHLAYLSHKNNAEHIPLAASAA